MSITMAPTGSKAPPPSMPTVVANHLRISDAVDAAGEPVNLPEIHFVKIQTGVLAKAPAIGEISTEVAGIYDFNLLK